MVVALILATALVLCRFYKMLLVYAVSLDAD